MVEKRHLHPYIKSLTLPVSLEMRSWELFLDLCRWYKNTFLYKLLDGVFFLKLEYFVPRIFICQLTFSTSLTKPTRLVFLRLCQLSPFFVFALLELHSSSKLFWSLSLKVLSSTTCGYRRDALIVSAFWKQPLIDAVWSFPATVAMWTFTVWSQIGYPGKK